MAMSKLMLLTYASILRKSHMNFRLGVSISGKISYCYKVLAKKELKLLKFNLGVGDTSSYFSSMLQKYLILNRIKTNCKKNYFRKYLRTLQKAFL